MGSSSGKCRGCRKVTSFRLCETKCGQSMVMCWMCSGAWHPSRQLGEIDSVKEAVFDPVRVRKPLFRFERASRVSVSKKWRLLCKYWTIRFSNFCLKFPITAIGLGLILIVSVGWSWLI